MRRTLRGTRAALLCGQVLAFAAACGAPSDPPVGQRQQPIWNGVPATQAGGVVYMEVGGAKGSGVALNNNWVLTARHVLADSFRPWGINFASIKTHVGNPNGSAGTEHIAQTATIVINGPWTAGSTAVALNYDMALVRFPYMGINEDPNYKTPIFHGVQGAGTITDQIVQGTWVECWGYGQGGPAGAYGTLRHAGLLAETETLDAPVPGEGMVHIAPPALFLTRRVETQTSGQYWQVAEGDSGGPCYHIDAQSNYSLAGIIRNKVQVGNEQNPVQRGLITSVGAYESMAPGNLDRQLQDIVDFNPRYAQFGDVDGDSFPDLAMLSTENGNIHAALQLTSIDDSWPVVQDGLVDLGDIGFPVLPESYIDTAVAAMGDFDGNGAGDILMFIGGTPVYYDGWPSAVPALHADLSTGCLQHPLNPNYCKLFVPAASDYKELRAADLNEDGFADLEAYVDGSSSPDIYYGSEHGLTSTTLLNGFPTSDGNDGKLLTLAVRPIATIGVPDYSFQVWAQHPQGVYPRELHIEVFDGDLSGSHDELDIQSPPVRTCFLLYADPLADGEGRAPIATPWSPQPLAHQEGSHFRNNEWTSLFDASSPIAQQEFVAAKVPGDPWPGHDIYSYILRMFLTTGACNQAPVYPDWAIANSLKLRANDGVLFWSSEDPINGSVGAISIVGSDSAGEFSRVPGCYGGSICAGFREDVDTTYDGNWTFNIATTLSQPLQNMEALSELTEFWLSEADADSLLDTISMGTAIGANAEIDFRAQDAPVNPLKVFLHPAHPTGQYDATLEPCARYDVWVNPPEKFPANVYWVWSDVLSHNKLWLSVPTTSAPATCIDGAVSTSSPSTADASPGGMAALRLYGEKPRTYLPTTSASPLSFWLSAGGQAQIATLLPIRLGAHGAKVHSPPQAYEILRRGNTPPQGKPASMAAVLKAELLVVKLNVARGAASGEDIGRGYIYATTDSVANVIDQADQALSSSCQGPHCPSAPELAALVAQLRAINQSNTTYRAPVQASPPAAAYGWHGKPFTTVSQSEFWRKH